MATPDAAMNGHITLSRRLTGRNGIKQTPRCLQPWLVSCPKRAEPRNDGGLSRRIPPSPPPRGAAYTRVRPESPFLRQSSMLVPSAVTAYPASTYSREDGMGQILGLGVTHFPPLSGTDENLGRIFKRALEDPAVPERLRQPEGWPAAMREEYGGDAGLTAARQHRDALGARLLTQRRVLDEFAPDFVVIWGDDQYENFKEDVIPPFCVLAYESMT